MASLVLPPHISLFGSRFLQTFGRRALPNMRQRLSSDSWMQRSPAGLPLSIPGIDEEIEGAMQQAAQPMRHSMCVFISGTLY
jgi:hypothetical protein